MPSAIIAEPWFQDVAGEIGHSLLWSLLFATVVTLPLGARVFSNPRITVYRLSEPARRGAEASALASAQE